MAFLRTKPNSKYFIAAWYDETGTRCERSTKLEAKQKNRRQAQRIAEEFEDASKMRRSAKQMKRVISDLHQRLTGDEIPTMTVRRYLSLFLERKSGETSEGTYRAYKKSLTDFIDWLADQADQDLSEVTSSDIARYRNHLRERVAESTVTNKTKALRAFFTAAQKDGLCLEEPTSNLKLSRKAASTKNADQRRAFTEDELRLLLRNIDGEWKSMVLFGIYTGQRLGDLATLRWPCIDIASATLSIRTRKTSRAVRIKISPDLMANIREQQGSHPEFVHPTLGAIYEKHGSSTLSNQFSSLLADCGLREKVSHRATKSGRDHIRQASKLSFHSLRVTAVSFLHAQGIPAAIVQEWVGHDSVDVHRVYVRLGDEAMEKASASLPSLLD
ncbi:tyrosine-type recombinase/integrase [Roseibacillus ishigakijimensis]|uniref:Tyrosine-type recombinase/integrase n=1 Tax=Roseibacillus ishigakijimensis TaxID=454146 RepID=A0A934RPZ2_9BACT|nr:tyrosine-type recombinase/integrase [Roseibacillus ishigakijimensis]MBK1833338.1 tyrosine-type recombinase/integrase [Roseibacillus ishigakijimensis]